MFTEQEREVLRQHGIKVLDESVLRALKPDDSVVQAIKEIHREYEENPDYLKAVRTYRREVEYRSNLLLLLFILVAMPVIGYVFSPLIRFIWLGLDRQAELITASLPHAANYVHAWQYKVGYAMAIFSAVLWTLVIGAIIVAAISYLPRLAYSLGVRWANHRLGQRIDVYDMFESLWSRKMLALGELAEAWSNVLEEGFTYAIPFSEETKTILSLPHQPAMSSLVGNREFFAVRIVSSTDLKDINWLMVPFTLWRGKVPLLTLDYIDLDKNAQTADDRR